MHQIEVKRRLVEHAFRPSDGWEVTVDIDAMERANGGKHPEGKREIAYECEMAMLDMGARITAHPVHGRADMVAARQGSPTFVVEVEGDTSKQREQAMYSALGQLLLSMRSPEPNTRYVLAVPDAPEWVRQAAKIPTHVKRVLGLSVAFVSQTSVRWDSIES